MNRKKVYIASPYISGDTARNVRLQLEYHAVLIYEGFVPYAPLVAHFIELYIPKPYEVWMEQDKEWVLACDCLLRIGGKSKGADKEASWAKEAGIPVFYSIAEVIKNYE